MHAPSILIPDTVALAITHLNTNLTPPVSSRVPNPRPAEFVTVLRTGGGVIADQPVVGTTQITVEAWAATNPAAAVLAELARAHLHNMAGTVVAGVAVYRVDDVGGPVDLPDPLSDQPRVTFTVLVSVRGVAFP